MKLHFQVFELCKGVRLSIQTNKKIILIRKLVKSVKQISKYVNIK